MPPTVPPTVPPDGRPDLLASDRDRETVVEALQGHCAEGRLSLEEFSDRVGTALAARTLGDLSATLAELPGVGAPVELPRRTRRWALALMGGAQVRGRFRVGASFTAVSIMGGMVIDLRSAHLDTAVLTIDALAVMGGVEVIVPEGIEVDLVGIPIMGGKELHIADVEPVPGSPLIRVRALSVMGGVTVRSKPRRDRTSLAGAPSRRRRSG